MSSRAMDLTRRGAIGLLTAAAAGWALWPVRPRSRRDIPPGRRVVTYWEKWTGPEGDAVQQIVDDFNSFQDRFWVVRVPISEIQTKAMVAIGGGDPPDIAGLHSYSVPLYAQAGALTPMDELGWTPPAQDYAPAVWRLLTHAGKLWAGVNTCYTFALYYNRTHFKDAGLNPDAPPRTVAGLDAVALRLTRTRGGAEGADYERLGFIHTLPWWWPYFWPVMFRGDLFDEAARRATIDSAANTAAYEWVAGYPRRYGRDRVKAFTSEFGRSFLSASDPFLTGRVSMCVQGPWMANFARKFAPELDYAAAPPPEEGAPGPTPVGMVEADVLVIPKGAREPEGAIEYVKFTQRREVQEKLCTLHCKGSPLTDVSREFLASHPNPSVAVHDAIAKSPRATVLPRTPVWKNWSDLLMSAFEAMWDGTPVAGKLAEVQARAQALLDRARDSGA